ncbi:DUF4169 family protein [Nannocystaceae bacterium ST9]
MSDVLNLNRFRKRKLRESEREQAERNRVVHGRSKAEKQLTRLERERSEHVHEGHRIVPSGEPSDEESLDMASDDGEDPTPEPE